MGSLAAALNVPECARPFYQAGLRLLFSPKPPGDCLPLAWESYLAKAPASPRVVWTYAQLAADLGSAPDKSRSELFRTLARMLAWPRGSIAFFPCTCPETGSPRPELLRLGLARLGVSLVVGFGADAADIAQAACAGLPGCRTLALPQPSALCAMAEQDRAAALAPLRELVSVEPD